MILAFIEHESGTVNPATLQMLTYARDLGLPVHAVIFGAGASSVERYGVSHIYRVEHPALDRYAPAAWARCLARLIEVHRPAIAMAAGTDRGNELLAWTGAIAGQPMAANCLKIAQGPPFHVRRVRFGGSLIEEAHLEGDPKLLTIAPFAFEARESESSAAATTEIVTPSIEEKDLRVRVAAREETPVTGVSLHTAPVVVSGGRGVGSAEGFRVLEELAGLLNGAVGGSRVATNNGWRPHSVQVGLTGNRIAPDLYIACGISGAIQHLVGCKGAKRVLVINKDREAPFFRRADYGAIGDLHEILPVLIAEVRKRKS